MNIFGLIANLLSATRFLIPVVLFLNFVEGEIKIKLFWAILLASTDLIDGFFARLSKEDSNLGKWLDHSADKVAFLSFALFLGSENIISWYVLLPAILFEVMVVFVSAINVHQTGTLIVKKIGKIKMVFFFLSLLFVLVGFYLSSFNYLAHIFIVLGTVFSFISFTEYKNAGGGI